MISWIQRNFQQHFRGLFAVLLGVIIVMFVFTIGAQGTSSPDRRGVVDRMFFRYNLSLQSDQEKLFGDGQLSFQLNPSYEYGSIENYSLTRAAKLHLADQWGIPATSAAEITEQVKKLRAFAGQDGQFDAKAYQTFRDNLKTNPRGLKEADIVRIVGDDVRAEKVQTILAGPGYILPSDIKTQLARTDTTWTLGTATVDYSAFKPEIKPADAEIAKFFEESGGRFDVPPQVAVGVIDFPAMNHIGSVVLNEADVRAYYDANPARFPKPADAAKPAGAPNVTPAADFAAVRPQVEAALKIERAQKLAVKAASDFSLALYESKAKTPEAVAAFLEKAKRTPKALAPFSREAMPPEFAGSAEAVTEAFRLGKDRVVSDALGLPTGAVILVWKDSIASRKPALAEVRDRVVADFTEGERRKRFIEAGKKAKTEFEARVKAGETLEKAAATVATATGLKIEAKAIPAFTLRNRPQDLDYNVYGALERLEKGQVSDMAFGGDKGFFVHAVDKQAPDVSDANPRVAETRTQLASFTSRMGATAYLSELVEQELPAPARR
jgi:peptidyl-prolyl cis-trans isomerase D